LATPQDRNLLIAGETVSVFGARVGKTDIEPKIYHALLIPVNGRGSEVKDIKKKRQPTEKISASGRNKEDRC
jgi:hypothetical protein